MGPHGHQPGANNDGDGGRHVREARHLSARGETGTVILSRNFVNTSYIITKILYLFFVLFFTIRALDKLN